MPPKDDAAHPHLKPNETKEEELDWALEQIDAVLS
jgi:hypothetical protein